MAKNTKMIMTTIDRDDLLSDALEEFEGYRVHLMQMKHHGTDPTFAAVLEESARKYATPEFAERMETLLTVVGKLQAAMLPK